jgi:hypothetical protein
MHESFIYNAANGRLDVYAFDIWNMNECKCADPQPAMDFCHNGFYRWSINAIAWCAADCVFAAVCACADHAACRGGYFTKSKSVHTLKGLALPRPCQSGEIALAGSRRLRSTLAAAPVLFAHAVVTKIKNK